MKKATFYLHLILFQTREWKELSPEVINPEGNVYIMKYSLMGIEPGKHETRARSKNKYGWSEWSEIVEFTGKFQSNNELVVVFSTFHAH